MDFTSQSKAWLQDLTSQAVHGVVGVGVADDGQLGRGVRAARLSIGEK